MRTLFIPVALLSSTLLFGGALAVFGGPPAKLAPPVETDRSPEAAKRTAVWTVLLDKCRTDKRKIQVYAENPALTFVCFVSDDSVFIYDAAKKEAKEVVLPHAVHSGINRVTYEEREMGGVFVLWYYGQREGSIDPTKFVAAAD